MNPSTLPPASATGTGMIPGVKYERATRDDPRRWYTLDGKAVYFLDGYSKEPKPDPVTNTYTLAQIAKGLADGFLVPALSPTPTPPAAAGEGKLYAERDPELLEPYYGRHLSAMTAERLHDKCAIAAELAWRDAERDSLAARVVSLTAEREKLVGIGQRILQDACGWGAELESDASVSKELLDALAVALAAATPPAPQPGTSTLNPEGE